MGVVDEPIEDCVGEAAAAEVLVPVTERQLGSDDGGTDAVAFLDGFEQVLPFGLVEGREAEVVDDEERELSQAFEQTVVSTLSPRLDELCEERG